MRWVDVPRSIRLLIFCVVFVLFIMALIKYPGYSLYYVLFSVVANTMLYFCFRSRAIFFDTFVGLLFWLGFWLKLTFRIVFMDGNFVLAGQFDGSPDAFDRAVLVATCGLSGLLLASYVRGKFLFNYPQTAAVDAQPGLFGFYVDYRKYVLVAFLVLVVSVGYLNVHFGIYQRGEITKTILPFGLNGVFTWLLLFGMASFVAIILNFELMINRKNYWWVIIYSFLEGVVSSSSQLSRGMIITTGSLLYGVFHNFRVNAFKVSARFFIAIALVFMLLFASSAFLVTYIRSASYIDSGNEAYAELQSKGAVKELPDAVKKVPPTAFEVAISNAASLLVDRWVGMEGVMAISSYPGLGWPVLKEAWQEVYDENALSFYDKNLIDSAYKDTDTSKFHFVSLPGIIAFFFYPGSYLFLFAAMALLGLGAALVEIFVFKVGGRNVILCSLLAQVIAYRFMSFGYVPAQSYLLFGSIIFNVLLIYFADKILGYWRSRFAK
jgi:hypothetical protein